jgi:putative (di)nucleoside polyphosphate hydrolase
MTNNTVLPYRPGVGVMLLNATDQVFVARRIDMRTEAWQMPQGGIDAGESPRKAVMRELEEEIGTAKADIIAESQDWLYYDLPQELIPLVWGGKFRGQKQKWFLMRFTGKDSDINIDTAHPEFHEWKWVEPVLLPSLIVPFKQQLYSDLLHEFRPYLPLRNT